MVAINRGGLLYRYVAERSVAETIARGLHRFYELTKYLRMEDDHGRTDGTEGAVAFPEAECLSHPEKLPVARFKNIEFYCARAGPDEAFLSQYFVLCLSTDGENEVMGDSRYRVEVHRDELELLASVLNPPEDALGARDGRKKFSHGPVEYYDIHHHPALISGQRWREVYLKHRRFSHQHEYRAALFLNQSATKRLAYHSEVIRRRIRRIDGTPYGFEMEIEIRAGRDPAGWRYVEVDASEFARKIGAESGRVLKLV